MTTISLQSLAHALNDASNFTPLDCQPYPHLHAALEITEDYPEIDVPFGPVDDDDDDYQPLRRSTRRYL